MDKSKAQNNNNNSIREQLKELGYLGGPMQQFLAGDISEGTPLIKTSLLVGIRVGMLVGVTIGILVAVGMIILNPALLESFKDVALLSIYLITIYSATASALAIVNSILLSVLFRISKSAATEGKLVVGCIGILSTISIFIYLIFWWQLQNVARYWMLSVSGILILLVILTISFLIGRLFTFASLVILWRVGYVESIDKIARRRGALALISLTVIVILFFSYLCFTEAIEKEHDDWRANINLSRKPEERLAIIGIDGLSWRAFELLIKENKIPNLALLANKGASGPLQSQIIKDESNLKRIPPLVWTTIATGMPPQRHGITSFDSLKIKGIDTHISLSRKDVGFYQVVNDVFPFFKLTDNIPLSGLDREEKTFWEILSEADRSVGVINWWLTWPAEEVKGFIVSDRTYPILQILSTQGDASDSATTQNTSGRPLSILHSKYETAPPDILKDLKKRFEYMQHIDASSLDLQSLAKQDSRLSDVVKTALSLDSFYIRCALELEDEFRPDSLVIYLQGLDVLQNMLDDLPNSSSELIHLKLHTKAIENHCIYLDKAIGDIVNRLGKGCTLMVVIDPGMTFLQGKTEIIPPQGGLIISGPRIRQTSLSDASVFDITPTILALSGLPISEEMKGKVLTTAIDKTFMERFSVETIPSFGKRETVAITLDSSADDKMYKHLKMLGYIE